MMMRIVRYLALTALLVSTIALAHSDGIYNPKANNVGNFEGIDSNAASGAVVTPMITPVLAMNSLVNVGPSNTAVNFAPFIAGPDASFWVTSATADQAPIAIAGSVSNLIASFPAGVGTGTYTIALNKNGSTVALTCTISSGTTCTDNVDSIPVLPGDTVGWAVTPSGTPTAATTIQIGAVFTSTNTNEGFLISPNSQAGNSTTVANYQSFGGSFNPSATEANAEFLIPTGGSISKLYIISGAAPVGAASYAMTVFKNGSATGLTCTITGAATTCNDLADSVTLVAGDLISLQSLPSGAPAAATILAGIRWVPTIPGEVVVGAVDQSNLPGTTGTASLDVNGSSNPFGAESTVCSIASRSFTVKKLAAAIAPAPGTTATRTFNFREGTCSGGQANVGTPSSLACTVTSAATSCQDTTNTYSASAGQFFTIQTTATGTNAALTTLRNSAVLTVP